MTVQRCAQICGLDKYRYFGVADSNEWVPRTWLVGGGKLWMLMADRCCCGDTVSYATRRVGNGDCDRVVNGGFGALLWGELEVGVV